jgi:hypothetical protein
MIVKSHFLNCRSECDFIFRLERGSCTCAGTGLTVELIVGLLGSACGLKPDPYYFLIWSSPPLWIVPLLRLNKVKSVKHLLHHVAWSIHRRNIIIGPKHFLIMQRVLASYFFIEENSLHNYYKKQQRTSSKLLTNPKSIRLSMWCQEYYGSCL